MKHVARAARVSVMTVSLALRRDPRIPAVTRERVLAIAAKLGYRRNPLVSALMAGLRGWHPRGRNAHVIAYVESYPSQRSAVATGALRRFRLGAAQGAARHGYRLQVFQMGVDGLGEPQLERVLSARGIRGVVFAPFPAPGSTLTQPWDHHALAAVGYSLARPPIHRALNHQLHSMRLAFTELMALGYRRIGVVMNRHEDARTEHNWLASVLLAQHNQEKTERKFSLLFVDKVERGPLRAWLRRERPEVVVSTEAGVPAMIARTGGPRVGFVHMHLTPAVAGYSGIDQNNERVGAAAVDLVVEQLHGNSFGFPENPKTVLIEGKWVRGTTALPRV
jgi:LacI family transcriptional regulator